MFLFFFFSWVRANDFNCPPSYTMCCGFLYREIKISAVGRIIAKSIYYFKDLQAKCGIILNVMPDYWKLVTGRYAFATS